MTRGVLFAILGAAAAAAAVMIVPSPPPVAHAAGSSAYPFVPIAIVPGMALADYLQCLDRHQVRISPACLQDGVLRSGTVEASSADHRLTVYADFTASGVVKSVKFRVMASTATLAQLDRLAGSRYLESGWVRPDARTTQATYTSATRQVTVYHLFECDPLYDAEPYYFAMDLVERSPSERTPSL
jgi:hypothetical protein